jgi:hypothetical protein
MSMVAKRASSPGPGWYNNINTPTSASKAARAASPGKNGFSFGKHARDLDTSLKY